MSPLATWGLMVLVVLLVVSIRVAYRGVRDPRRAGRAGEAPLRRRAGAELHVVDHEVRGWFGADEGPASSTWRASREAAPAYPLSIDDFRRHA